MAGAGIAVDNTDPTQPVVGLDFLGNEIKCYTLVAADYGKTLVASDDDPIVFSLDPADDLGERWWAVVKNDGPGPLTLDPDDDEEIDGEETLDLATGQSAVVVCDGIGFRTLFNRLAGDASSGRGGRGGSMTLTEQEYDDLLTYRQALRDLPENTVDPAAPEWPVRPIASAAGP